MIQKPPFYAKYFYIVASLVLTLYIIIVGRDIINPLLAATIFAIILKPLGSLIERVIPSRLISSLICVLMVIIILLFVSFIFSSHISSIAYDMANVDAKLNVTLDSLQQWGEKVFGVAPQEQIKYLKDSTNTLLKNSMGFVKNTLLLTTGVITYLTLFVISLFFILYYRKHLVNFIYQIFNPTYKPRINKTLYRIEAVLQQYALGLALVICIIAVLNAIGLFALGIEHAVLFGIMGAVLTIIPYVGILIGAAMPMLFALITKDSWWYPLGVAGIFMFVQFFEGNFITPNIVGNQVKINPFAAILSLFMGGMLLGMTGVLFAIPIIAVINVISSEFKPLKPISFLISDK